MERRTKLILAGSAVAAGGLALVVYNYRRQITSAAAPVVEAAKETAQAVVEKAKEAVQVAREITGSGIPSSVLENFQKYNITEAIERTRGDIPWPLAASIVELESGGDPGIYNYYPNGVGKPPKKVGYWRPGQPLPDGTNGQPNAWAAGIIQIIRKYPRGLSLEERFDAEKSLRVIMPEWKTFYSRARNAGLSGRLADAAVYFAHNKGPVPQQKALSNLKDGFEQAVRFASGLSAAEAAAGLAVALRVANRVPLWQAVEAKLKGNDGAVAGGLAGLAVDQDYRDWAPAPIFGRGGRCVGFARARMPWCPRGR